MNVNALTSKKTVTGEVLPPCVMVSSGWLGEEMVRCYQQLLRCSHWINQVDLYCWYGQQGDLSMHCIFMPYLMMMRMSGGARMISP